MMLSKPAKLKVTQNIEHYLKRPNREQKRVNLDFPTWMIESLDNEAARLGVTRQSIIKIWLAERLEALHVAKDK